MAIPDYADERSHDFFSTGLVGKSHGDNGSAYRTSWNSQCDAEPTRMIRAGYRPVCAYCGNAAMPLQPNIQRYNDYEVTGYTCCCTGAMDEVEWRHELTEMENNHAEELRALQRREPPTNPAVIKRIVGSLTQALTNAEDMHEVRRILEQIQEIRED